MTVRRILAYVAIFIGFCSLVQLVSGHAMDGAQGLPAAYQQGQVFGCLFWIAMAVWAAYWLRGQSQARKAAGAAVAPGAPHAAAPSGAFVPMSPAATAIVPAPAVGPLGSVQPVYAAPPAYGAPAYGAPAPLGSREPQRGSVPPPGL